MTVKTSISGAISDTLTALVGGDHYGAQVIDVQFYDDEALTVQSTPTGGTYTLEWSPNGRDWNGFDNILAGPGANDSIGDWQAHGYIDSLRFTPNAITGPGYWKVTYRAHRFGNVGIPASIFSRSPYFNVQNVASIGAYEFGALSGDSYATSSIVTFPANSGVIVSVIHNAQAAVLAFSRGEGLTIRYCEASNISSLVELASGYPLNRTLDPQFQLSFEAHDSYQVDKYILSSTNELQEPMVINGGGFIEFFNASDTEMTLDLSVGVSYLGDVTLPYMLTSSTQLEPNTEMSTYNGTN